jgi:hypothetical protein
MEHVQFSCVWTDTDLIVVMSDPMIMRLGSGRFKNTNMIENFPLKYVTLLLVLCSSIITVLINISSSIH